MKYERLTSRDDEYGIITLCDRAAEDRGGIMLLEAICGDIEKATRPKAVDDGATFTLSRGEIHHIVQKRLSNIVKREAEVRKIINKTNLVDKSIYYITKAINWDNHREEWMVYNECFTCVGITKDGVCLMYNEDRDMPVFYVEDGLYFESRKQAECVCRDKNRKLRL